MQYNNKKQKKVYKMINYNSYDLEYYTSVLASIEKDLGVEVDDDEVWTEARKEIDIPIFENILMDISFKRIEEKMQNKYPSLSVSMYINARDSFMSIDGQVINTFAEYREKIEGEGGSNPGEGMGMRMKSISSTLDGDEEECKNKKDKEEDEVIIKIPPKTIILSEVEEEEFSPSMPSGPRM